MTFFLLPLLLVIIAALLLKRLLPGVLEACGWPGGTQPVLEERFGAMAFLVCAAVMAGIAYWYPWYLCTYHAAPDDRYGFALLFAFPFYFIGAGITGVALFRLVRAIRRRKRSVGDAIYGVCGALLAVIGFSPLFMIARRIISLR